MRSEYAGGFGGSTALPAGLGSERRARPRAHSTVAEQRRELVGQLRRALPALRSGIMATASMLVGLAAAGIGQADMLLVGLATLAAGGLSLGAGEFAADERRQTPGPALRIRFLAALSGAVAFAIGGALPLLIAVTLPVTQLIAWLAAAALIQLVSLVLIAVPSGAPRRDALLHEALAGGAVLAVAALLGWLAGPLI